MLIACGVCSMGMTTALFPPTDLWAVIGVVWFLSLSILRAATGVPGRIVPGVFTALIFIVLLIFPAAVATGPVLFTALVPLCLTATGLELYRPRCANAVVGRKAAKTLGVLALLALGITTTIEYRRVSTMSLTERVQRVANTPGVGIEVLRIARNRPHPIDDFKNLLDQTDDMLVASAVCRYIECPVGDHGCAMVLVDALARLQKYSYRTDCAEKKLRVVTGLDLKSGTAADEWRSGLQVE